METGILYVVFNKWIRSPETNKTPYKIGITRGSVYDRYYGLGLKMPGKFETLFAYQFEDCAKAEQLMHGILNKYRENGEWFNISQNELDLIKKNCEIMGGIPVTDKVKNEIETETENELESGNETNEEQSLNSLNIPNLTDAVDIKVLGDILKRGVLRVDDNICFRTTVDALNSIFGQTYKQGFAAFGKCYFLTKEGKKSIWFPPLNTVKKSWTNTMPDEEHVQQEYMNNSTLLENDEYDSKRNRAIFVKKPGGVFQFAGIFNLEKYEGNTWIFKRISTELYLQEWDL